MMHELLYFGILTTVFFEPRSVTSLPVTRPLSMDDVQEKQGLHANWKSKRIYRRQNTPAYGGFVQTAAKKKTRFPIATSPGFYGPEEFASYYALKFLMPWDKVDTTKTLTGKGRGWWFWAYTEPIDYKTTITPTRGKFYHEVYWKNGHRILFTPYPLDRKPDQSYYAYIHDRYLTVVPNNPDDKLAQRGLYTESFYCNSQCNQIFVDWGPVCGARLKTEANHWNYEYKSFVDYCDLLNFNCAFKFWCYIVAMRGRCPRTLVESNVEVWNQDFLVGDVAEIRLEANYKVPYLNRVEKYALSWFPGTYKQFSDNTVGFEGNNITWWM